MSWVEVLGLAAGVLTTLAFVPQVITAHRTRATRDLSLPMLVLFNGGIALWLAYGLLIGSGGLIMANAVTGLLSLYILSMKLRFG